MRSPWHLRGLVLAAYAINGFCLAAWNVRLPAIAGIAGMDSAELGRFLMAGALGTLVTIPLTGRWVVRYGEARVYLAATVGFVVAYLALAASLETGGGVALILAHVLHGAAFAATNVPQSVLGTVAEARVGRSVLSQFHAAYSIAAAGGAAVGGLAATVGVGPVPQFLGLAVFALVSRTTVVLLLRRETLPGRATVPTSATRPPGVWRDARVLLFGLVVFGAALSEGTANNWLTPALIEHFPISEGAAATAVSVFLIAQTFGRLVGGVLVDRAGPAIALTVSGTVAAAAIVAFAAAQSLWVCWIAVVFWGLGAALSLPVAVSQVGRGPGAAARIAAVTSLSSLANVAGPPAVGAAGELVGLRWSIGAIAVVLLAGVVAAQLAVRRSAPAPNPEPASGELVRRRPHR